MRNGTRREASQATALRDKLRGTWVHHMFNKVRMAKRRLLRRSEGEAFLLKRYAHLHGKPLDVANAQRFTGKLFKRLIELNRGEHPEFTQLADSTQ